MNNKIYHLLKNKLLVLQEIILLSFQETLPGRIIHEFSIALKKKYLKVPNLLLKLNRKLKSKKWLNNKLITKKKFNIHKKK
jgi:hypothetical protein